ncbi:alpha/beta fold hydrolase [Salinicoccus hispanicus]|uniref:Alpha/beta fold hydrolase n=1 Tax=Salinicoccus hispanicus TaxID=157225 RepID=A0A6N8TWY5_9STAP|nr:alpha/beta hydrolase [Salinicoccus hispanicus]MXQ49922.1 alpha/beta fold hydrolase [Salinicoccus hispanicus]
MKISEEMIYNQGRHIRTRIFSPEQPICAIQLLHGMAEHMGRYSEMMTWFAMNDCMVIMHDHRGHGEDDQDLGHFDNFNLLVEDALAVSTVIPDDLPKFILGHSMGSIVARRLLERRVYDGGIIVGTGSKDAFIDRISSKMLGSLANAAPRTRSKVINRLAFAGYDQSFPGTMKNRWLSEDDGKVEQYNRDDYCGFLMSNRALAEIVHHIQYSQKQGNLKQLDYNVPILLIGGKEDPFSNRGEDIRKLARIYRNFADSVTVQLYGTSRHEVLFEKNREQVYNRLVEWVMRHV